MITIIPVIELEAKLRGDITITEKAPIIESVLTKPAVKALITI